jgi:chemotaxis protein MotD
VFSVAPEPAVSTPVSGQRSRQPRAEQPSPDGFGALIDANTAASAPGRADVPAAEPRRTRDPGAPRSKAESGETSTPDAPAAQAADTPATTQGQTADKTLQGDANGHAKIRAEIDAKPDTETTTDAVSDDTPSPAEPSTADPISQSVVAVFVPVITMAEPATTMTAHPTSALPGAADAAVVQTTVMPEQAAATQPAGKQPGAAAKDATDAATPALDDGGDATAGDKATASRTTGHAAAAEAAKDAARETAKTQPSEARHASVGAATDSLTPPDPAAQLAAAQAPQPPSATASAAIPAPQLSVALAANTLVPVSGLAVDIALRAAGGSSRFEIRLDPAELGRIDVRLEVDKHGNVTSHLTVERPATLDMLRNDAPKLQQALEDAGLKTGDGGLQFSLRDQSSSSGQDGDRGDGRNSARLIISEDETVPAQVAGRSYGRRLGASSGVDIRI